MSASQLNTVEKRAAVSLASVFAFRMLGLFMLMLVLSMDKASVAFLPVDRPRDWCLWSYPSAVANSYGVVI